MEESTQVPSEPSDGVPEGEGTGELEPTISDSDSAATAPGKARFPTQTGADLQTGE